ncbi:hypothetical protein B484DRAFT_437586 [Ochromonadaceae sp. CCMP2298]|nr:hypothetical protein B484DRAFT_437586 [Ochromonadaceae sp. CCMP2298]
MKSAGRGFDQRGRRSGGRGRNQPRRFSNVQIIDRDPAENKVLFEGGSASAFVLVVPLMVKRAKSVGVIEFWTGELKKDFFVKVPFVIMHYDPNFVEPCLDFVGDMNPVYQYRQDEEEHTSGIQYGGVVVNTSYPEYLSEHVSKVQDRMLKWYSAKNKHQEKLQLADTTLRLKDAWDALHDKYGAEANPWEIAELDLHLGALKLSHPAKLADYHNKLQTLIVALDSSGMHKTDVEIAMIQEASLLSTPYNHQIFETAFVNARQNDWSLQKLEAVLQRESEALVNKEGMAELRERELSRAIQTREKRDQGKQGGQQRTQASLTTTTNKSSGKGPAKTSEPDSSQLEVDAGTDGRTNPNIECYSCHEYGHIAGNCPTKKSKPGCGNYALLC